ncbi:dTDP-glucose 4,6-dehydratase [Methylobacterium crusticola]|uniref:dTDP-glucose 4,6-dehydratase n=1 Tax=Methylobacterium crusticola TaxID=1697972 RepID=A0ABQ4R8G1_9HYPH|nr:NAD(P)-dependent oxidoreductase [Methylobacterium crusticola]GJD54023.1 dTDP-glucose 4,6-dehydratase [Methylobacterium crusticola]
MSEKAPILVTGAAGLLGNMVRQMLEARGNRVIAVDRTPGRGTCSPITECDLGDVHRLHELARDGLEGVIHCGAHSGPMVARDNPFSMVAVNIVGTANVLEVARVQGASRLVYCSSTSAYGPTPPAPVPEDIAMRPTTVYGASKVAGEQLVSAYAAQYGLDGTSLRLSWVYGPRRSTDCAIRTMITDAQAGRPTRLPFGRDFPRQYIYVEDAAGALVAAFDKTDLPRRIYTITGGTYMTLGEVADLVRSIFPRADIELGAGPDPFDDVQQRFEIAAAERDLGYAPRHSLESGIRAYAAWLADQSAS